MGIIDIYIATLNVCQPSGIEEDRGLHLLLAPLKVEIFQGKEEAVQSVSKLCFEKVRNFLRTVYDLIYFKWHLLSQSGYTQDGPINVI